ncbi:MAG: baseplate J/gp47 family protein [Clostridia bacterium]|nr:baseplate J/gp47 family protein [Clostridia bacterium]
MINAKDFYDEMCREFQNKSGCTVYEDSDVGIRFSAVAAAMQNALDRAGALSDKASVEKCSNEMLDIYAKEYGIEKHPATKAIATLQLSVDGYPLDKDLTVQKGTLVASNDGWVFATDKTVSLGTKLSQVLVTATAVDAGRVTLSAASLTNFCSPVSPLLSVTNNIPVDSGSDAESYEHLRKRLLILKRGFPCLINRDYIRSVAMQFTGVLDAAVTVKEGLAHIVLSVESPETFDFSAFNSFMFERLPLPLNLTASLCEEHLLELEVYIYNPYVDNCLDAFVESINEYFKNINIGQVINNADLYRYLAEKNYCESFEIMGLDYEFSITENEKYKVDTIMFFEE